MIHEEKPPIEKLRFNVSVAALSNIKKEDAVLIVHAYDGERYFKKPVTGKVIITYPLGKDLSYVVDVKHCENVTELLWDVSQAYREIYRYPRKYGIWGHSINQLFFERVDVYPDGRIEIGIGS